MKTHLKLFAVFALLLPVVCQAGVDKVYHPYVTPLEREFEWRIAYERKREDEAVSRQRHKFAYGYSLSDQISLEAYIVGERVAGKNFELEGYELEAQLQLSEQGEFWADWGLLLELDREKKQDRWKAGLGLLFEKEQGKWSTTTNLISAYEYGSDIEHGLKMEAAAQLRYRFAASFEPAVEFYWDENNQGLGPVMMGLKRFGMNKLKWELGIIFMTGRGLHGETVRSLLEYEF